MSIIIYSAGILLFAFLQAYPYFHKGHRREGLVFLGWMGAAWVIGILFMLDFRLPEPTKQLFPNWK